MVIADMKALGQRGRLGPPAPASSWCRVRRPRARGCWPRARVRRRERRGVL